MNIIYGKTIDDVKQYIKKFEIIYIYGAGRYAKMVIDSLGEAAKEISAAIVTSKEGNAQKIYDIPVMKLDEIAPEPLKAGFILTIGDELISDVIFTLEKYGYSNVLEIEDIPFLYAGGGYSYTRRPAIEITAKLGCSIQCKYCPQTLLYQQYFAKDKKRITEMSFENYKICIDKMPQNVLIIFSGFVEPFLHKDGADMICYAHESGREVILFTTLVGLTEENWEKIKDIPFYNVTLHTPDQKNWARIPITEEYIRVLDKMLDYQRPDGKPFIDYANCQSEPSEEFLKIAKNRVLVPSANLMDRAGNLKGDNLQTASYLDGEIYCKRSYNLDKWVLLPDGTVVLCCMDFGLKHPLGNLITDEYDEIKQGKAYKDVVKGLREESFDTLCRRCTNAKQCTKYSPIRHIWDTQTK